MLLIYLCSHKHFKNKMSRVRFHGIQALEKLVFVKWWGPGWPGYDNTKTVQQNLDTLDMRFDMAIVYKPLEMLEFNRINIPKCIRYNEMFDTDWTRKEIRESGADLVICHHLNEMQYYTDMEPTFEHIAHCAKSDIFKPRPDIEKEYDLLLVGALWDRYPIRLRMQKIFKEITKVRPELRVKIHTHPGYDIGDAHTDRPLIEFAKEINKAKIAVTCTGKYRSRYGKMVEIPMCGTAIASDIPDEEQSEFKKFVIRIGNSMTDSDIMNSLFYFLDKESELERRVKLGLEWSSKYTQKDYARRFLDVIFKFLDRDHHSEPIIQSLWIGDSLSKICKISIKSFIQLGHTYHLYTYSKLKDIPEGVVVRDGNEILDESEIFRYKNGSVSAFSNAFRYKLLFDCGNYWVDTDFVCVKRFDFRQDYIIGSEPVLNYTQTKLNPCVIKAPYKSMPMFQGYQVCMQNKPKVLDGTIQWDLGPSSLRFLCENNDLSRYVVNWRTFNTYEAKDAFIPLISSNMVNAMLTQMNMEPYKHNRDLYSAFKNYVNLDNLPDETYGIHLYNQTWKWNKYDSEARYADDCLFEQLKNKLGVKNKKDSEPIMINIRI